MGQVHTDRYVRAHIEAWLHRQQPHTATMDIPELGAAVGTTIGEVRKENQDRLVVARLSVVPHSHPITIFALCDGLGGMVDGAQCAERTIAVLIDAFIHSPFPDLKDRVKAAVGAANQEIFRQYRQSGGTTLALLCRATDSCFAATVGDTRIYALGPRSSLAQLSTDDTIAGVLGRRSDTDQARLRLEPFANQLAQFVGIGPDLEPRLYKLSPPKGMSYFIVSDGAYSTGTVFERVLANAPGPLVAAQRIIHLSRWAGGKDNASIICIGPSYTDVQHASEDIIVELWNATGKLEIMFERRRSTVEKSSPRVRKPVNSQKDQGRKAPKGKPREKQYQIEPSASPPNRPMLQIEFGAPTGQNPKGASPEDANSQDHQPQLAPSSSSTEPQPPTTKTEEGTDAQNRGLFQNP